ncbi:hypothetical protein CHARACLAT_017105 [Characodon lateralis]|uniref:Uncharacterized protein n=1 Tax=Characodon lateralis TaxID=208331 RepID=A0ABU7EAD0_9TELE|nr:hypothetical protein [Characodon lateralis]
MSKNNPIQNAPNDPEQNRRRSAKVVKERSSVFWSDWASRRRGEKVILEQKVMRNVICRWRMRASGRR